MRILWLAAAAAFAGYARAHSVSVDPHSRECFFEDLHTDDHMTVSYQVAVGEHLAIDFWLMHVPSSGADPQVLDHQQDKDTGSFGLTADSDGRYKYCFANAQSTPVILSFNVHGVMYVDDDSHLEPIEREIRELASGIEDIVDEQEYIVTRERNHRNTAESTCDRVKWWSIIQLILVFGVCLFQVYYLQHFFEVKRVY